MEKQDSYSHILKYTGIFGSVQGLNILIGLVRNKLVALILGPVGMGTVALFTSTVKLLGDATNLGLPMSAVREISEAFERGDAKAISRLISVFRLWCWLTAFVGMLLCVALSQLLSSWTFSFGNHTLHFIALSPVVALTTITAGETAILKATRRLRSLAIQSVYGVLAALLLSVPIYYFFGMKGIVPSLVIVALAQMAITIAFSFRLYPVSFTLSKGVFVRGFGFVRLGLAFVGGSVMGSATEFLIRSYLNNVGQVEVVGLYNAAYMMVFTYAGMVFTAMETDYYPRLSAVPMVGRQLNDTVNMQIEASLLLISPLLVVFVVSMPVLLPLLYSGKFLPVLPMLQMASLSMYARAVFLPIEYISLSRADSFSFLTIELISYAALAVLVIFGYDTYGLFGTGLAITVSGFLETIVVYVFYHRRYKFILSRNVVRVMAAQFPIGLAAYLATFINSTIAYVLVSLGLFIVSLSYSLFVIRRNTHFAEKLKEKIFKKMR